MTQFQNPNETHFELYENFQVAQTNKILDKKMFTLFIS